MRDIRHFIANLAEIVADSSTSPDQIMTTYNSRNKREIELACRTLNGGLHSKVTSIWKVEIEDRDAAFGFFVSEIHGVMVLISIPFS